MHTMYFDHIPPPPPSHLPRTIFPSHHFISSFLNSQLSPVSTVHIHMGVGAVSWSMTDLLGAMLSKKTDSPSHQKPLTVNSPSVRDGDELNRVEPLPSPC